MSEYAAGRAQRGWVQCPFVPGLTGRRRAAAVVALVALSTLSGCSLLPSGNDTTPAPHRPIVPNVVDYRATHPDYLTQKARYGHITYPMEPPAGGDFNPLWQDCQGEVYGAPIANEHAVHSLELGAVWVTYRPDLPGDQARTLEDLVRDRPYMMMSPYPGLDAPVSLQAWGYQLKVDNADDPSILQFIRAYRIKASVEPTGTCSGGITDTGTDARINP